MILITKDEKNHLVENGARWEKDIHRTYSKHPKYYITESDKMIKALNKYRASKISR